MQNKTLLKALFMGIQYKQHMEYSDHYVLQ